jgi:hypothetical protein
MTMEMLSDNVKHKNMDKLSNPGGCQLLSVPKFAVSIADTPDETLIISLKRILRSPWNLYYKRWLKKVYYSVVRIGGLTPAQKAAKTFSAVSSFATGDIVLVRSREEILSTLDPFNELKGCTFFHEMFQYCGTQQRVFKVMQHFMDERDYKFKRTHGIILLENLICTGNSTFGKCDRCCFLFWREEWLEKI